MNEAVIMIICFILLAVGISLLKSAVKAQTAKDTPFVLINAKNPETIEHTIRRALKRYPEYTIYVFNRSKNPEMGLILDAINKDFGGIHIINGFR